jgi:4-diphosphocytidyl-2-C-methyl-D-erythritol kinase
VRSGGEARVEAQAKVNLVLRVLAREDSGYHQIETLFCRIALADTVTVRTVESARRLDVTGDRVPAGGLGAPEKNLAWLAATAYAGATGFPSGFEISIEKRIPVGGGLGGGSADAGAVLRALNALNPRALASNELLPLAKSLGADVPFLTQDSSTFALGRGHGERLAPLPALAPSAVWLLVPAVGVSTADAYRWIDESDRQSPAAATDLSRLSTWEGVATQAHNDFEAAVSQRVPIIGRLLANLRLPEVQSLLGPSPIVLMSGSGSTVAVISGQRPHVVAQAPPPIAGVEVIESETSAFVEPVVLTH